MDIITRWNHTFDCPEYLAEGGKTLHLDKARTFASFDEALAALLNGWSITGRAHAFKAERELPAKCALNK